MAVNVPRDEVAFGDLLRRFRARAGLTQEGLAERAGLSVRGISDLERGLKRHPRKETLRLLLEALPLTPADRATLVAAARPAVAVTTRVSRHVLPGAETAPPTLLAGGRPFPGARLPRPLDSFVGRQEEVAAILGLLRDSAVRLLTLGGPGGTGKTRLAVEAATVLRSEFADGVAFVSLAPIVDPDLVTPTIAQALGIPETGPRPIEERLATALRLRRFLLVLDNFEQVLAAAAVVARLLADCPELTVLVTSRVPLQLSGEHRFPVSPLPLPDPVAVPDPEEMAGCAAVALFVQRARQVRPEIGLDAQNAPVIAEICRRLDGLPLAIELAAARSSLLSPAALLGRLDRRLPLLVGGPQDQPPRLQTMRDAIAWSYDLLTPELRALFRRLAVFVGGFDLDAAAAVADLDGGLDVFEALASLVDNSLLRPVEQPGGEPRFVMLETVREFGLGQLAASGEDELTGRRHAEFFRALAEESERYLLGYWDGRWMVRLEADLDNLRAALTWTVDHEAAETACRLVWGLMPFWFFSGRFAEGREWAERTLGLAGDVPTDVRIRALQVASGFARILGDFERNRTRGEEGLALARASGNRELAGRMLLQLLDAAMDQGHYDLAEARLDEVLAAFEGLGDSIWLGLARREIGMLAWERGDYAQTEARLDEALAYFRTLGHPFLTAGTLRDLGEIARRHGDLARATEAWKESLAIHWNELQVWNIMWRLEDLGIVATGTEPERGVRLLSTAEALRSELQTPLDPIWQRSHDNSVDHARVALGPEAFAAAWEAGLALSVADAVAEAMLVVPAPGGIPPTTPTPSAPSHGLTPRELEILRLIAEGHSNREIAEALFVSPRTVDNHVTNLLAKLEVKSSRAAIAAARRLGLV